MSWYARKRRDEKRVSGVDSVAAAVTGTAEQFGTSSVPITTSTADVKLSSTYLDSSATSGDTRVNYMKLIIGGAGGNGEAIRVYTLIDDVAAGTGTQNGAHISLSLGTSGTSTGQAFASRHTLELMAGDMGSSNVTYAAINAEIWCPENADADSVTNLSFIRFSAGGNSTAIGKMEDGAFLFSLQGFTAGTGSLVEEGTGMGTVTGTLKIKIGADTRYIPFYSAAG